eukprot:CAMPEP_0179042950 /NCGR_PEP_ID=MMETSP0796-20121207/16920_1 /TAXON_ID=73915 /ORGANISM="Pyrodinium bahamense, Strain pbaha01" /LENGTH=266 /DNA_ID=CAMNT_0020739329 /DNA_START=59 /DNA_END=859 /DNA_ORIENTATION=-
MAMKSALVALALQAFAAEAIRGSHSSGADESSCQAQDEGRRAFLQAKLASLGVECEEMCKRMNMYPNCQCPGFEGNPASDGDFRMCITKYCQDPSTPCPTDSFVTCVKENTKVSVLQWAALIQRFGASLALGGGKVAAMARQFTGSLSAEASCQEQDRSHRAFIQAKLSVFGVECEEMCKRMNMYPNCQCPGFEGNPAFDGDDRLCIDKYCQDPSTPCPTDSFVTCVKENTKVSVLQWGSLLQRFDSYVALWNKTLSVNKTAHTAM